MVQFIINEEGDVVDVMVLKSISPLLDAEALRVVRGLPRWEPAFHEGENVKCLFRLPISFKLT